ncbi:hypothetical protein C8Q79DRAFT_927262 [Trametes meyenii]|nr:hypothetical protein C8Q79DRAFT_927262 [Trametes meyenii]
MPFPQPHLPPPHGAGHRPALHVNIFTAVPLPEPSSTPGHGHPTTLHSSEMHPPFPPPGPETPTSTPGHGHTTVAQFSFAGPSAGRAQQAPTMPVPTFDSERSTLPSGPRRSTVESDKGDFEPADVGTVMHSLAGVACQVLTEKPEPFAGASSYYGQGYGQGYGYGYPGYGWPAPMPMPMPVQAQVGGFNGGWRF